ncbi:hypothetical protein BDR07DRAFT_1392942 [Suillus spraguei]|nr:hypothetical protein BDR07DRAFT_1392942 [Suillus spraguei]
MRSVFLAVVAVFLTASLSVNATPDVFDRNLLPCSQLGQHCEADNSCCGWQQGVLCVGVSGENAGSCRLQI